MALSEWWSLDTAMEAGGLRPHLWLQRDQKEIGDDLWDSQSSSPLHASVWMSWGIHVAPWHQRGQAMA
jgi:hypothetical protein